MYLAGLQAAGHAVLVDAAAAIGQAAITAVQLCAGHVHIAAAIHQQVLPSPSSLGCSELLIVSAASLQLFGLNDPLIFSDV